MNRKDPNLISENLWFWGLERLSARPDKVLRSTLSLKPEYARQLAYTVLDKRRKASAWFSDAHAVVINLVSYQTLTIKIISNPIVDALRL